MSCKRLGKTSFRRRAQAPSAITTIVTSAATGTTIRFLSFQLIHWQLVLYNLFAIKVNESRYKQFGVTPHFSTGENLLKKILIKDRY